MTDVFHSIVDYVNEYPEIAAQLADFLFNNVWAYWFDTMGPSAITVYNQDIRTNNYIETYHASILRLMKPHPKVWEFLSMIQTTLIVSLVILSYLFLFNLYYLPSILCVCM